MPVPGMVAKADWTAASAAGESGGTTSAPHHCPRRPRTSILPCRLLGAKRISPWRFFWTAAEPVAL